MKKLRTIFLAIAVVLSLIACQGGNSSGGANWTKSVEIQVPAKAGGGTDVMARALAANITKKSGSNITIVNNTDGGGVVAMETVRNAKSDGSVLMQFHTTMLIKTATGVYDKTAADDFTVIGVSRSVEKGGTVLLASSGSGMNTLDDVIARAKAAPDTLLIGIETGGTSHVIAGMFARAADIKLKYVEAGTDTEKLTALVGGSIDLCFANPNQVKQYIESGKVVVFAVVSSDSDGGRSSVLPDVPSFIEQGIDFSFATLNMFLGPKNMNEELVNKIYNYYVDASKDAEVNAILEPAGFVMEFLSREDGIAAVKNQQENINAVVEGLGLKQ